MNGDGPPDGLTPPVAEDWRSLASGAEKPPRFTAGMTSDLPEPVRRWLTHAIDEGTPLARAVELRMHGEIFLGRWSPFTAVQRLSLTRGFVWAATTRLLGLPIRGFDRWSRGTGEMRWRLFGILPVASAAGVDVTRSAAGRHAGELLVAAPAAALSGRVKWQPVDAGRATARIRVDAGFHEVELSVDDDGALTSMLMSRWGAGPDGSFGVRVFGADFTDEATFEGFTIPRTVVAGWDHGTPGWGAGQFIRYTVDTAHYR